MEAVALVDERSVLIVDESEETQEVLSTALGRRGVRTFTAGRAREGLDLARQLHPDLIVLDLELDNSADGAISPFAEDSALQETPMVLLGSVRRHAQGLPDGEFVRKPYHFAPLIRKIEELLSGSGQAVARGV